MVKRFELGQMLVKDRLITPAQLKEAVYNQVIFGGRLGTNLLELGYIDEETLAKYLARQHRVKTIRLEDLSQIRPSVLKLIPRRLAEKYQAIPIRLEGNKLYVVMSNPSEMGALSELSFVTGKTIIPLVLPEVRIFDLLNRYYGIGRELRYMNIAILEAERRKKRPKKVAKLKLKKLAVPIKQTPEKEKLKKEPVEELISEEEFQSLTTEYFSKKQKEETEQEVLKPSPESQPAPPLEKATPKQVALAIYRELVRQGIDQEIPQPRIQDFLKAYIKSELKDGILSLKLLANFLRQEASLKEEKLNQIINSISRLEESLGITMVRPEEEAVVEELEDEVIELEEVVEPEKAPEPEIEYLPEPEEIVPEPEIPELSFEQATKILLEETQNRDDLARAVLGFAKGFFSRAVLFTVRNNQVFGWQGFGEKITTREVQNFSLSLDQSSLFKTVVETSCHYLGPVIAQPENERFLEALGGIKPQSVFLIPLLWQEKVVYILYGDNGEGANVPFEIGELLILAQKLPSAIQRLIEEKKKQYQVIQGGKT